MNYYYDVYINMNDTNAYEFYEWLDTDPIEHIRKIPVIRTNSKVIKDVLNYYVKFSQSIMDAVYLKTEAFDSVISKSIEYMFLVTDTKSAVVVECDSDGYVICLSKLNINDEVNLLEIGNAFKEQKVSYETSGKRPVEEGLRLEREIKDFLLIELNTLKKHKKFEKLKYIYYEWTNELENDEKALITKLKELVKSDFGEKHYQVYELIKLSYKSKAEI